MSADPELSIVAPAQDEEQNLRAPHVRTRACSSPERELALVGNGSPDCSADVSRALASEDACVRGELLSDSRGRSAATPVGLRAVRAPLLAALDADLQRDRTALEVFWREPVLALPWFHGWHCSLPTLLRSPELEEVGSEGER